MTAHNIDLHAVDTMLQNTLQLHRQLNRNQSGVTRGPNNPRQQQQPPGASGLGLGSSLRVESGPRSGYNSGTTGLGLQMDRSFSDSSSNGLGSSGPLTVIASPPSSTDPGRAASHTISPSSPIASAFSSPQIPHLPSSSTFASYNDHPTRQDSQPTSIVPVISPPRDLPALSVDTAALLPSTSTITPSATPYTRSYTKSLSAGTHSHSYPSPQPHTRRTKVSLGGVASMDHNGRPVHHLLAGHDPKDSAATIFINVRDIAKDLWVRLEIPRNIPVQKARDLILAKCQRTMSPPSAPSSVAETLPVDDEPSTQQRLGVHVDGKANSGNALEVENKNELDQDPSKTPTHRSKGNNKSVTYNNTIPTSHPDRSMSRSSHYNNSGGSDQQSQGSLDEEDIQMRAEAIITRLDMFVDSINGFGDHAAKINYTKAIMAHSQNSTNQQDGQSEFSKGQLQLRRLLSHPSMGQDDHGTSPPERQGREGGASRLVQLPGWSQWRERHNSHTGKNDVYDLGDVLIDCTGEGQEYPNETVQKDCEAWKASFGLFWVAAGHWLDDSRLINSYHLQPQDVLELQRRDHYIQLPPPGSNLSYYDHYAEGVLFKLSKKNRPVSMFSNNGGKESTGVWKERWVVLQGSRLLIYHKRKDVNKKSIDLPIPLNVLSRVLPQSSRQMFKFTPSSNTAMSSTMIALDISPDPMVPKLCFRGTSEHDISHWTRIFNSLNSNTAPLASPMFHAGPGSPMTGGSDMNSLSTSLAGYSPERRRVQTTSTSFNNDASTVPSINPVLISNAAAAISNLHHKQSHHASTKNSNGNHNHYRNLSQANNLKGGGGGAALNNKDLNLLHHRPLNVSGKEDIRRRAITEPNRHRLMNPQQQRGHLKQSSKVSAQEIDTKGMGPVDVSNVSEAPFRLDSPPGRKRRPVLGTEYLDNASEVLLATSSARSSTAPVYSGYIWLYIPQAVESQEKVARGPQTVVSSDSPGSPKSQRSGSSKATGRYVKCFAAINDQGHFQWVEVKKQNDLGQEQDAKADIKSSSRSSYGIQLAPSQRNTESPSHRHTEDVSGSPGMPSLNNAGTAKKGAEIIQASMIHKLRLYFFCVKISPSALKEVLISMVPPRIPSPTASPPTVSPSAVSPVSPDANPIATLASSGAAKVANKVRHRLSSSLSTLATAAKPPLPNMKSQSLSGSISKGKNATWPSISSLQDKDGTLHPTATPGSTVHRPLSQQVSSSSLRSNLSNISTIPPPGTSWWPQGKEGDGPLVQSPASANSPDPESPSSSTSSSSNVLSLAQGPQQAVLQTRSNSGSDSREGLDLPAHEGVAYGTRSPGPSPTNSGTRPKMTLSEVMAAKQASIPDSAATMEQSKLLQEQIELQQRQQRADERLTRSIAQQQNHQLLQEAVNLEPRLTSEGIRSACPYLELNRDSDELNSDQPMVTLKGYTETEEGWKILQWALEKFLDEPIQEHCSALPPDDTLIPSYHFPPEIRLSEKAQMFLSAKASMIEEANLAASMAAVDAVRSPTPDITRHDSGLPSSSAASYVGVPNVSTSATTTASSHGPVAQIRATSVSLTRWMNLSGGGGDRDKNKKGAATHRPSSSVSAASLHAVIALSSPVPDRHSNKQPHMIAAETQSVLSLPSSSSVVSKRGLSPNNVLSLSVGAGSSLFRPRPRLSQQRSVDELSNVPVKNRPPEPTGLGIYESDQQQTAVEQDQIMSSHYYGPSKERSKGGSIGSVGAGPGGGGGLYTTSAAMIYTTGHSTEEFSSSNSSSNTNLGTGTTTAPSRSKGRDYCEDMDRNALVTNEPNLSPPSSSGSGKSQSSFRAPHEIEEESENVVVRLRDGDASLVQQQKPPPLPARPVGDMSSSRDRTSRASVYSAHPSEFNNHNSNHSNGGGGDGSLQLREVGYDLGLSLSELENPDGTLRAALSSSSAATTDNSRRVPRLNTPMSSPSMQSRPVFGEGGQGGSGEVFLSSMLSATHPFDPSGLSMGGGGGGLRVGDDSGTRVGNGRGATEGQGGSGSGSGGGEVNKKHQTVLGAGRAAVTSVFGKFRKSIG